MVMHCEAESVTHLGALSASGPGCVKTPMTYPFLDLSKRRRPQRKRLLNRRCLRPRLPNHGCPWIQKFPKEATVMVTVVDARRSLIFIGRLLSLHVQPDLQAFGIVSRVRVWIIPRQVRK